MNLYVFTSLQDMYGDHVGYAFIMAYDEYEAEQMLAVDFPEACLSVVDFVLDVRDNKGFYTFIYKVKK